MNKPPRLKLVAHLKAQIAANAAAYANDAKLRAIVDKIEKATK